MKKEWNLIPKIISGEKRIESRWYKAKYTPWNKIKKGDSVFFKNSGKSVTACAKVSKILQFDNLNEEKFKYIINNFNDRICLTSNKYNDYYKSKKYCILIFLENPKTLKQPFNINKTGFGSAAAWLVIENIKSIKRIT